MTKEVVEEVILQLFEFHTSKLEGTNEQISNMLAHRDRLLSSLDDKDKFNEYLLECMVDLLSIGNMTFIGNLVTIQQLFEDTWF